MPSDLTQSPKPIIFISYAHKDDPFQPAPGEIDWLEYVLEFLRPGETVGGFSVWVDLAMMGGANWEREIEQKLRVCDIFILLVSRRSMASKYILNKELPIVRERDAKGEPIHIYPLLLTATPKIALDLVRDKICAHATAGRSAIFRNPNVRLQCARSPTSLGILRIR